MRNNYFYHHGIKGQVWGKRNGPPYPLNDSNKSPKENRLARDDKNRYTEHNNSNNTALAKVTTYSGYKIGSLNKYVGYGKNKVNSILNNKVGNENNHIEFFKQPIKSLLISKDFIKKLSKPESLIETLKNANPLKGTKEGVNNCVPSAIAGFMRQIGYDVTARGTGGKMQNTAGVIEECFKGVKVFEGTAVKFGKSRNDASEMLIKRYGKNAEGICSIDWKSGGGHCFGWKIKNGTVSFFDSQSGHDDDYITNNFFKRINPNGQLVLARLDDVDIDLEAVCKYVKNN